MTLHKLLKIQSNNSIKNPKWPTLGMLSLALLLNGCATEDPTSNDTSQIPKLSFILPSPAEVGLPIKLYGTFPENMSVSLSGQLLTVQKFIGGVEVQVPSNVLAGENELQLGSQKSKILLLPHIQKISISQNQIIAQGWGWVDQKTPNTLGSNTQLEINGTLYATALEQDQLTMSLDLLKTYGDLGVRVKVGNSYSYLSNVGYRAGTVRGQVLLPSSKIGSNPALSSPLLSSPLPSSPFVLSSETPSTRSSGITPQINTLNHNRLILHCVDVLVCQSLLSEYSIVSIHRLPSLQRVVVEFSSTLEASRAVDALNTHPQILDWEWDSQVYTDGTLLHSQSLQPQGTQWFWFAMHLPEAWLQTEGEGVTVAVVDTGVLSFHPDLRGRVLPGYDFVERKEQVQDTSGHGTHVAGLIAAQGLVRGAAPRAQILPVRVLRGEDGGNSSTVAEGILWAAGLHDSLPNPHPAQIINLSLGSDTASSLLQDTIKRVLAKGILVVAAAGNDGGGLSYPAALPGVLAVTALAGSRNLYQPHYASRGAGLSMAGIGGDYGHDDNGDGVEDAILSTDLATNGQPGYGLRAGTSMATPEVSGIAALALSTGIKPEFLKQTLEKSAQDFGPAGYDLQTGYGLINAGSLRLEGIRTYIMALDEQNKVLTWTTVLPDGSYTLYNIPPQRAVRILAATDHDNDHLLGESQEEQSDPRAVTLQSGETLSLAPFALHSAVGQPSYTLTE